MGRKEALWAVEEASLTESNESLKKQLETLQAEGNYTAASWHDEKVLMQEKIEQQRRDLTVLKAELIDSNLSSQELCTTRNNQLGELEALLAYSLDVAQDELDTTVEVLEGQKAAATSEMQKEMNEMVQNNQ